MVALKLAISSADGVGMEMKTASKFSGAGEALGRFEVTAQNAEHDLSNELLANADVTATGEPEAHGRVS